MTRDDAQQFLESSGVTPETLASGITDENQELILVTRWDARAIFDWLVEKLTDEPDYSGEPLTPEQHDAIVDDIDPLGQEGLK